MERYGKLSKNLSDSVLIAFIHFLHNGTEIVLITIIYEMSAFAGTVAVQGSFLNDRNGSKIPVQSPARERQLSVLSRHTDTYGELPILGGFLSFSVL